jgi:hypothetical protein
MIVYGEINGTITIKPMKIQLKRFRIKRMFPVIGFL